MNFKYIAIFILGLLPISSLMAHNHDEYKGFDIKITDLGSGIYELRTDRSGNVGLSIGIDGVFMIDSQMEHLVELIDSNQKKLSNNQNVDIILNTHLHRDHVRGNAYFNSKGAIIMAHPNVRKYLKSPRAIKALDRAAPIITEDYFPVVNITADTSINMNGQTIELYHPPSAHTDGDIFVRFKEANVIHAGDLLFSGRFPFIDIDNGGSVSGYIEGLKMILDLANLETSIIAGHGPTSSIQDIKNSLNMLQKSRKIIYDLVQQGLSLKEVSARSPLKEFTKEWSWAFITTDLMVQTHYYDLTGKLK